jgi:cholest-4-en-3-one 26-monooxygenase
MTTVDSATLEQDRNLLSPDFYAGHGYPHAAWSRLRREDPVHRVTDWDGPPYWAITRRAEIIDISKTPQLFSNVPRMAMQVGGIDPGAVMSRTIIRMDPPEHDKYRGLIAKRFTPRFLQTITESVDEIANKILDSVTTEGALAEMDFVKCVAAPLPIWVVAKLLGVPQEDWRQLFNWTNESVGASDPEYQQGRSEEATRTTAMQGVMQYFAALAEDRRRSPRDDISTLLVQGKIDGKSMPGHELLLYFAIILAAGNETTRNAASGGLLALIRNPDQHDLLRARPDLVDRFVEEVLRYVSPVIHMCRTPKADAIVGGKQIRAGEDIVMFYPSANRDESVYAKPHRFEIERPLIPHLAFGIGEHFCLGNNIARMELRALFRNLIPRLKHIELLREPQRLRATAVGGLKHVQVRYCLDGARPAL